MKFGINLKYLTPIIITASLSSEQSAQILKNALIQTYKVPGDFIAIEKKSVNEICREDQREKFLHFCINKKNMKLISAEPEKFRLFQKNILETN